MVLSREEILKLIEDAVDRVLVGELVKGDALWALSSEEMRAQVAPSYQSAKIIAEDASVLSYLQVCNSDEHPMVWAENAVACKNSGAPGNFVTAYEASVSNNTGQVGLPNRAGALVGFWSSYIHARWAGSAAFASCAFPPVGKDHGWMCGLWLDGIATNGVGIVLEDELSGDGGMSIGIDLSRVYFGAAAMLLGNSERGILRWKNRDGSWGAWLFEDVDDNILWRAGASQRIYFQGQEGQLAMGVDARLPAEGETTLSLMTTTAGKTTFQRVLVGEPDSGGPGYRALRVPN